MIEGGQVEQASTPEPAGAPGPVAGGEPMLTTPEMCEQLRVCADTLRKWARLGCPRVKIGRMVRWDVDAVKGWLIARSAAEAERTALGRGAASELPHDSEALGALPPQFRRLREASAIAEKERRAAGLSPEFRRALGLDGAAGKRIGREGPELPYPFRWLLRELDGAEGGRRE